MKTKESTAFSFSTGSNALGKSMMMQVGSRVVGKTNRTRGRIGIVLGVNTEGCQRKFEVEWSCGAREIVSARSISLTAVQEPQPERENASNVSTSTFTDLLLGVNEGASIDMDASSSSDEDELNFEDTMSERKTTELSMLTERVDPL
ncbi:hypothetical protein F443_13569 [Phytophthora nicotianae P1569]|uniref:Uncharacterized protein n=1 Tax=Phytophthora nicotianae P1569 TaxID=1317065 RepID=V9ERQ6_PHYNI|nr:hypothetical protein F443_13569 [Phytophthora nicotianae P1569]